MKVTITHEEAIGKIYRSPYNCPLACKLKEMFPEVEVSVSGYGTSTIGGKIYKCILGTWDAGICRKLQTGELSVVHLKFKEEKFIQEGVF
jgi:hypothetical protein